MIIVRAPLTLRTERPIDIIDVTARARSLVSESGLQQGQLLLFSAHSTAFVCLNEKETMLQQDMLKFLEGLAPARAGYLHDRAPVDGRLNAHAHLLGLFMNASETIPIVDGQLALGGWQSIFFVELDGPREERHLLMQLSGIR